MMPYNQPLTSSPMSPSNNGQANGIQLHPAVAQAFRQRLMGGRPQGPPGITPPKFGPTPDPVGPGGGLGGPQEPNDGPTNNWQHGGGPLPLGPMGGGRIVPPNGPGMGGPNGRWAQDGPGSDTPPPINNEPDDWHNRLNTGPVGGPGGPLLGVSGPVGNAPGDPWGGQTPSPNDLGGPFRIDGVPPGGGWGNQRDPGGFVDPATVRRIQDRINPNRLLTQPIPDPAPYGGYTGEPKPWQKKGFGLPQENPMQPQGWDWKQAQQQPAWNNMWNK